MLSYDQFKLDAGKNTASDELYSDKIYPIKMTTVFFLYIKYISAIKNITVRQFIIDAIEFYIKEKIVK